MMKFYDTKLTEIIASDDVDENVRNLIEIMQRRKALPYMLETDLTSNPIILYAEKILKIRKPQERGYNVTANKFFINEQVKYNSGTKVEVKFEYKTFDNFEEYYNYLEGDIYKHATYYGYNFTQEQIQKYSLNPKKINYKSLIKYTIDDFTLQKNKEDLLQSIEAEKANNIIKNWINKLDNCTTYEQLTEIKHHLHLSPIAAANKWALLSNFIYGNGETAFQVALDYMNKEQSLSVGYILCLIYGPDVILPNCNFSKDAPKYLRHIQAFSEDLKSGRAILSSKKYFDNNLNLYVCSISTKFFYQEITATRYFEHFHEFAEYLNEDLSDCNLVNAEIFDLDISKYKSNEHTIWPIDYQTNITCKINKQYDRFKNEFCVVQKWENANNIVIKKYTHIFKLFIDFAHFLNNDLSKANLLFCDGLANITNLESFNFKDALLLSALESKLNPNFSPLKLEHPSEFQESYTNELETIGILAKTRQIDNEDDDFKIYYISDIHLMHRIFVNKCISISDIIYTLYNTIDKILSSINTYNTLLLIGGDTSSTFLLFEQFVVFLDETIKYRKLNIKVAFTLGNHELWSFAGMPLCDIYATYRTILANHGMYLIQNSILYKDSMFNYNIIDEELLSVASQDELYERLKTARLIIFGGIGFSGQNEEFNANKMIYRETINRTQEIDESKKFKLLYDKLCSCVPQRNVIIFTHMPKKDWSENANCHKKFIYVSGHTHKNEFYDDGDYRIYADNQVGYHTQSFAAKFFYARKDYDIFERYADGIYTITRDQYKEFHVGKIIPLTFERPFYKLFMLKKVGTYMFIMQYENGNLYILNGGAIKRLPINSLEYYFNNMDKVIERLKNPLNEYTQYQKKIAASIKSFGGSGNIHGAIIDIDYYNHIYVNPYDLKITSYWAMSMTHKIVYPSITALLQDKNPSLLLKFNKLSENDQNKNLIIKSPSAIMHTEFYPDTDIYKASNIINKMQKLYRNILTSWPESTTNLLGQ